MKFLALLLLLAPWAHANEAATRELRFEALFGRTPRVEHLIRTGADPNGQSDYGETALGFAILYGHTQTALKLLELGANPNHQDPMERTPLLRAATDCNTRISQALLKRGADFNHADHFGITPLITASRHGCVRTVALLLSWGGSRIDIEQEDHSFHSALDYADHPYIREMIELALERQKQKGPALKPENSAQ